MPIEIDYLGEGASDEAIARKLILHVGAVPGRSYGRPRAGRGKDNIDRRLSGLNAGAAFSSPILVLRDLDNDAPCAATLIERLVSKRHANLVLRVCVRAAEAWLLADRSAYAAFCGVPVGQLPAQPETLDRPKDTIIGLANTGKALKLARFVSERRRTATPDWAILGEWHASFVETRWDPERAAASGLAPSLPRALRRLRALSE